MEVEKDFGKALKSERESREITGVELSKRAGVHPTYLSAVEHGKQSPTLRKLVALASVLKMLPSALLREAELIRNPLPSPNHNQIMTVVDETGVTYENARRALRDCELNIERSIHLIKSRKME